MVGLILIRQFGTGGSSETKKLTARAPIHMDLNQSITFLYELSSLSSGKGALILGGSSNFPTAAHKGVVFRDAE